ncbi:aldo/keto reductase [Nocardia sp. BMG111209]|uniref:aldo/keto reductase n=1 Tax=Nocardia sp. BMG111209 TaxID=1160137 RepID=UPI0003A38EB5|nr:aldo/keto reductase [Nocardia sp. BMG111209]
MSLRPLGTSSLQVSPIVFGGNVFGWTVDESASFALLDALADAGINSVDSADVYSAWVPGNSGGESEEIIGRWLQRSGKRDSIVIATKVGGMPTRPGLSRANILRAAEDSLRRLRTDHIDLYYSHRDDADTPQEETLGAYQTLIEQGKVRVIAASNFSGARLREAAEISARTGLPAYAAIQPEYNLYDRSDYETDLEPVATDLKLGVVTYRPLASGFLTGKYRSEADLGKSPRGERTVPKYLNPRGLGILAALDAVADKHTVAPATVAVAWQLTRPGITAPIASATSIEQLRELGAAAQLSLDAEDVRALEQASAG